MKGHGLTVRRPTGGRRQPTTTCLTKRYRVLIGFLIGFNMVLVGFKLVLIGFNKVLIGFDRF